MKVLFQGKEIELECSTEEEMSLDYLTPQEPIENNTTVVDVDMDNLNFSHYLYDIDGNLENETSAKIMNSNVYLTINGNEHVLNNFGNPI